MRGDRLCHVYSDTSLEELVIWGARHGLRPEWVHDGTLPHYDAFGERLAYCGPGVTRAELKEDLRAWRADRAARGAGTHPRQGHLGLARTGASATEDGGQVGSNKAGSGSSHSRDT